MCLRGISSDRAVPEDGKRDLSGGGGDDADVRGRLGQPEHSRVSDVGEKCLRADAVAAFFSHRHISEKVSRARKTLCF